MGALPMLVLAGLAGLPTNRGDQAVCPALTEALGNVALSVRRQAAERLREHTCPQAVEPLVGALGDADRVVHMYASLALFQLADRIPADVPVEPLVQRLASPDPETRATIAETLGKLGRPEIAAPLLPLLVDAESRVRMAAATALGRARARAAVPGLLRLVRDPVERVREEAVVALGEIADPAAIPALLRAQRRGLGREAAVALTKVPGGTERLVATIGDPTCRGCMGATAIAWAKDRRAVPLLLRRLTHPGLDSYARQDILRTLGRLGDARAVPVLECVLEEDGYSFDDRRIAAAGLDELGALTAEMLIRAFRRAKPMTASLDYDFALWHMGSRAEGPLINALHDEDPKLRVAAVETLGRLRVETAIPALVQTMAGDPDGYVRHTASVALVNIGHHSAIELLLPIANAPDNPSRREAACTLARMPDQRAVAALRWVLPLRCFNGDGSVAALALAELGDQTAVPLLQAALARGASVVPFTFALQRLGASPPLEPLLARLDGAEHERNEVFDALVEMKDPRSVEPLLAHMAKEPFGRAAVTLARIGDARALPRLLELLVHDDAEDEDERGVVRAAIAAEMPRFGAAAAEPVAALLRRMPNYFVADAAAHLDATAVPPLLELMEDAQASVESRSAAARALGAIRDSRAVAPLLGALRGAPDGVRVAAAYGLGLFHAPETEDALVGALKDPDTSVQCAAAPGLGALRSRRAVPHLVDVFLANDYCTEATDALGQIGDARAVPVFLEDLERPVRNSNRPHAVVRALALLADPRASPALISRFTALHLDRTVARGIVDAGQTPEMLKRLDAGAAEIAAGLAGLGDPRADARLARAYDTREWPVLCAAWDFFVERGHAGSEAVLIEALHRCGRDDMADGFYNSGNDMLRRAALRRSRFFSNVEPPAPSAFGPRWGVPRERARPTSGR